MKINRLEVSALMYGCCTVHAIESLEADSAIGLRDVHLDGDGSQNDTLTSLQHLQWSALSQHFVVLGCFMCLVSPG